LRDRVENFDIDIKNIDILVNSAGVGHFAMHEDLTYLQIKEMVELNLLAPVILTKTFLKRIKKSKGTIINISSISSTKPSRMGALYSATKSALTQFSDTLFEECRKDGVRVVSIVPDTVKTNFFDNLRFCPTEIDDTYIEPETIAKLVIDLISYKSPVTKVYIHPQMFQLQKR